MIAKSLSNLIHKPLDWSPKIMGEKLHLLILDDNPEDVEMELSILKEAGYDCLWERIETREDFLARIKSNIYDIIIADHGLPPFDGISALRLLKTFDLDTPFVLVSATTSEEAAIESLRAGAVDYVMKTRLSRLGYVVRRALLERTIHRQWGQTQEALKESEEKFRIIFEESLDMIAIIDVETKGIVRVNRSAYRLFGYKVEELIGKDFSIIFPPASPLSARELLERLTIRNAIFESQEFMRADGAICFMDLTATVIRWGKGKAVLATFRDATERMQAGEKNDRLEQQLIQAQKMESIGRLAGGIAHDFNNLLTAIIGYSQLLLAQIREDTPFRREIEEIMRAGQRAGALTSQLLAFSRQQRLERRVININDTISNLINMLRRIIGEDVEVSVQTDARRPLTYADPTQVEQVLLNLAVNARDAMPGGGRLTIRTDNVGMDDDLCLQSSWARPGKYTLIEVTDTGEGMNEETVQNIFDPFFTTKPVGKGTGLGLSVVYGIVNQHDGLVNVRSTPGGGASFEIYLPSYDGIITREVLSPIVSPQGKSETILVAEDEPALQTLITTLMEQLGYKALIATNGEEAIRLYLENRDMIRAVLLDLVMPRMGGYEAYSKLRALGSHTPVILVTGYTTEPAGLEAPEENDFGLLRKPYSISELAQKIRDALERNGVNGRR